MTYRFEIDSKGVRKNARQQESADRFHDDGLVFVTIRSNQRSSALGENHHKRQQSQNGHSKIMLRLHGIIRDKFDKISVRCNSTQPKMPSDAAVNNKPWGFLRKLHFRGRLKSLLQRDELWPCSPACTKATSRLSPAFMCECSASSYCYHHYQKNSGCHQHHCASRSICFCHDCCHHKHNFHHHHDHCFCQFHNHHHHCHTETQPSPCQICVIQYCVYGCHKRMLPDKGSLTVKESIQTIENGQTTSTTKESVSVTDLPEEFAKLVTSASITNYNRSSTPSSSITSQSSPTTPSPPLPSSSGRGSSSSSLKSILSKTSRKPAPRVPSPAFSAGKSAGNFAEDSLQCHNEHRQIHGVAPLKLNQSLCNYAQEWANQLAQMNTLRHRSEHKYGENIFMTSKDQVTGRDAVDSWYSEIKDHTFGKEPTSMNTGHFTQVIWKSSTELGIAKAHGKSGTYVVANYDPPGNMLGEYVPNVPAPL